MLQSLKIEGFRGFQSFEMANLGRINLLVGKNNSGKTSILEAIQFLYVQNMDIFLETISYRGEFSWSESNRTKVFEICHLFPGHEIIPSKEIIIIGSRESHQESVTISVKSIPIQLSLFSDKNDDLNNDNIFDDEEWNKLLLSIRWSQSQKPIELELLANGTLARDSIRRMASLSRISHKIGIDNKIELRFLTPFSLTSSDMAALFDNIVLSPLEDLIIESLKIIEPKIERIASVGSGKYLTSNNLGVRGGFLIKIKNHDQPIPIGSLGDGFWRMLGLVLAMVNLENGILLVDEIDSGLHFTVMTDMWKVVWETAKKLNIQVFATTHSRDCWQSLAELITEEKIADNEITIQRIDREKSQSVIFDPEEIVIAATSNLEVR
ncbi:MAG: recombination protein F [Microcystis wesenbergii Mw_QC_S_20081001_S30D]|jgi:AAA15 family ATPase/GTPase|uniref:Recombination protein F n=1 Tax=Microcystis wesenbergii Mw_QC_S_20081001_S30D TaxID=2486245 RepID=A0A552K0A3_9CHRO|nr:ATP-binding protein [Microcystis aeruginosa W11-03]NCR94120.1 ATP-binding protein [Microcystis aeruginosa W11-06]TRV00245.1 MAG: recombination protein F [Microcystis wesenbergii Mw_QC_B_20070930_S4D]TRV01443.1 MAG: recombination protein F [Microcystis wesenbergii Mw_QC_S_20081001_S30D]TRV04450.1 MAG: recombination protein F [Microcystis wesenbergii Mw_QC_S_20081001_S30]TRV13458.1 MAG: recombination protein F [Microcystis wesenbergii Mw_QC_B_20070930_S4]